MPVRKRTAKRRPAAEIAEMFLHSDGICPMFTGDPVFTAPSAEWISPDAEREATKRLARAGWEAVRTMAWRHPFRRMWPPRGALWDGIWARALHKHHPTGASPHDWSVEPIREAYEVDVADVEAFRKAKPAAAADIADELDDYLVDLRMLMALADEHADDRVKAGEAWADYIKRRDYPNE